MNKSNALTFICCRQHEKKQVIDNTFRPFLFSSGMVFFLYLTSPIDLRMGFRLLMVSKIRDILNLSISKFCYTQWLVTSKVSVCSATLIHILKMEILDKTASSFGNKVCQHWWRRKHRRWSYWCSYSAVTSWQHWEGHCGGQCSLQVHKKNVVNIAVFCKEVTLFSNNPIGDSFCSFRNWNSFW